MMSSKSKTAALVLSALIVVVVFALAYASFTQTNESSNPSVVSGCDDVYYYLNVRTTNASNYVLYIPFPRNVVNSSTPNPIFYGLEIQGNVSVSLVDVSTPYGKDTALKVEGSGNALIQYHHIFYWNSSNEKMTVRDYQITDLHLLKNRTIGYIYLNSSEESSYNILLNTSYSVNENDSVWSCYWKISDYIQLHNGWNEIRMVHYCDPEI